MIVVQMGGSPLSEVTCVAHYRYGGLPYVLVRMDLHGHGKSLALHHLYFALSTSRGQNDDERKAVQSSKQFMLVKGKLAP